jgi:prepilin-type N-terminal cleavage/methylation domain-containing protein
MLALILAPSKKHSEGFTLIEVLIAVVILAYLMLHVYNIVDSGTKTKESVTTEDAHYFELITVLNRLDYDISQAYSPLYFSAYAKIQTEDQSGQNLINFEPSKKWPAQSADGLLIPEFETPNKNDFIFFSAANRRKKQDQKQSSYAWIRYFVRDQKEPQFPEAKFELVRQVVNENIYTGDHEWEDAKEQVILKNLKDIDILFWNSKREKFVETLRESEVDKIFRAVLIKGILVIDETLELPFEKIIRPLYPIYNSTADENTSDIGKKMNDAIPNSEEAVPTSPDPFGEGE